MKFSIVKSEKVRSSQRLDAEYFDPTHLDLEGALSRHSTPRLSEFCDVVSSAFYPSATHLYSSGDVPFMRCVDLVPQPFVLQLAENSFAKLPKDFLADHKNIQLIGQMEIAISKVGSPCFASIIYDLQYVALSRTVLGLKNVRGIDPFFLTVYLRCKYGFQQMLRERELTIQYQLTLDRVRSLKVYKPREAKFEQAVVSIFHDSVAALQRAFALEFSAKDVLLDLFGLKSWEPNQHIGFTANYSEIKRVNRIDAEYFHPHVDQMLSAVIASKGILRPFSDVVCLRDRNFKPVSDRKYNYIELSDIGMNGQITEFSNKFGYDLPTRARRLVHDGDVIISSVEGLLSSVALISSKEDGFLCSTGFHVAYSKYYNPETLLVLAKSPFVQWQLKRACSGTILTAIAKQELNKIQMPIIHSVAQAEIKKLIKQMYFEQSRSKELLDVAKRAVEIAIEEDEEAAIEYIAKAVD